MKPIHIAVLLVGLGVGHYVLQNSDLYLPFEPSLPPGPITPVNPADPATVALLKPLFVNNALAADFVAGVFDTTADLVERGQFKTRKHFGEYMKFLASVIATSKRASGVQMGGVITATFSKYEKGGDLTPADRAEIVASCRRIADAARAL